MDISVSVLQLGIVHLPDNHPRSADRVSHLQAFVIHHPDGPILVDTGCADDHEFINELYRPEIVPIVSALNDVDVDERDIVAIVNTHLHFDHCGHNRLFPDCPVWVQRAELEVIEQKYFTVVEWARIDDHRRRVIDGDETIAEGVTVLATPGHTPGHQSVLVETNGRRELIAGQVCYTCAEFEAQHVSITDMHDESWLAAGRASLSRLTAMNADVVRFSHDVTQGE